MDKGTDVFEACVYKDNGKWWDYSQWRKLQWYGEEDVSQRCQQMLEDN